MTLIEQREPPQTDPGKELRAALEQVMAELRINSFDAVSLLLDHAAEHDVVIADVSADVVRRTLRFTPSTDR